MPLSGKALATAYVVVRADMSHVADDVAKGTGTAVDKGAQSASRKLKDAVTKPLKEGFDEGARQAGRGGETVGGRLRQGIAGRLRGVATDTTKAGAEAGAGLDRGLSSKLRGIAGTGAKAGQEAGAGMQRGIAGKMRDVAGEADKGGKETGRRFGRATGAAVEKEGGYLGKLMKSTGAQVFGAFAAEAAGEKVIEFFTDAVSAASDLSEAGNKLQVLFGGATNQVVQWAQGAATSLGLSQLAAEDAAATFGVFAKSAGLGGTAAAGFSEKMVGLAGDFASFYNTSPEQAIEAIGAALRGESEPIRAYGILLDDATLRQRALKLGLISTTKDALTPQQRVLAAQAEILAQSSAAQGDFARTSGGLANQQRILAAQFENAKAALGQGLLPIVLGAVSALNTTVLPAFTGLIHLLGDVPGPVYIAVAAFAALRAAMALGGKIALGDKMKEAGGAVNLLKNAGSGLVGFLGGPWGIALTGASVAVGLWAQHQQEAAQRVAGLTDAIRADSGALGEHTRTQIADMLQTQGVLESARLLGLNLGTVTDAILGNADAYSQISTAISGYQPVATGAGVVMTAQAKAADDVRSAIDGMNGDVNAASQAYKNVAAAAATSSTAVAASAKTVAGSGVLYGAAASQAGRLNVAQQILAAVTPKTTATQTAQATTLGSLVALYPKYKDTILASVGATSAAAGDTAKLSARQVAAATAAVTHQRALDGLVDALSAANNATLRLRGGETAYWAAISQATDALKTNGRTLDVHTAKGRANRTALDGMSSAGLDALETIRKNIGVGPAFNRTLDQQRSRLITAARNFGMTKTEAFKYADQIYKVPKSLATRVTTPGIGAARAGIRGLAADIAKINGRTVTFHYRADGSVLMTAQSGASHVARAAGGRIPGFSPTPTADNVPVAATADEHMWSVQEVRGAGGHANVERLRGLARTGQLAQVAGFAAGGAITLRQDARLPVDPASRFMTDYAAGMGAGGGGGGAGVSGPVPKGSGVARWGPMVHRALAARGLPQSLWDNWMRQIQTESGGNPNAVQGNIGDINNRTGDLAKGILQTIGATFRAYHVPGTSNNIFDAWANMNAAMNYGKHRYHNLEAVIGHGHGYAAGTRNADPGWNVLGENGPELVRMRGGEDVRTATETRSILGGDAGPVRLHPDSVALLAATLGAALARQPVVIDGRTIAGYVDRSMGRAGLSMRG